MNKLYYILVILICTVGFAQTSTYTSFSTGEVSPDLHGRIDARKYYSGCRILENFFVWTQGPVEKRRGTYFVAEVGGEIFPAVPEVPEVPGTYTITYISENGKIWGIPLLGTDIRSLDIGAPAREVGGGIVGLPFTNHPFSVGQVIRISGVEYGVPNYHGEHTLTAGTSTNELQIATAYRAEVFTDSARVVQYILMNGGTGRMAEDEDGNLYYGHIYGNGTYLTKIETDGTLVYDFFEPDGGWDDEGSTTAGVAVTSDNLYIYLYLVSSRLLYKFDLGDGSEIWKVATATANGNEIAVDSNNNVYVCNSATDATPSGEHSLSKFDASDGTETDFTEAHGEYACWVDNDMGLVFTGGFAIYLEGDSDYCSWNVHARQFDGSGGAKVQLGDPILIKAGWYRTLTVASGCICTLNGYVYVLCNEILYKLDTDLNIVSQTASIEYAVGLFPNLWDHIVIVCQDPVNVVTDILRLYDEDLTYVKTIGDFYLTMLRSWDSTIGAAYIQGNASHIGTLGTPSTPAVPALEAFSNGLAEIPPARLLSFEHSEEDGYVIEAGTGYMRFYKDIK